MTRFTRALRRILSAALVIGSTWAAAQTPAPIHYSEFKVGHARYLVVTADLNNPSVHCSTVLRHGTGSVWSIVGSQPFAKAAITGTFFAPSSGQPVGDVLVDGALKAHGRRGSVIAFDSLNRPSIFDPAYKSAVDWSQYRWALRGLVRLVRDGKSCPNPKGQKFHDRRIWGRAARTAAGLTADGQLILLATKSAVTLSQLAKAMLRAGARQAVVLDGGSSTCLFYRNAILVHPSRRLSNMLIVSREA